MIVALPIFDVFTGKQARNIFCLNDQSAQPSPSIPKHNLTDTLGCGGQYDI